MVSWILHGKPLESHLGLKVQQAPGTIDKALIARCIAGDRAAQREFIERHKGFIFRTALKVTANYHWAEDLSQEALLRILDKLPSFKGETPIETWIYRVTVNLCLDHLRRGAQHKEESSDILNEIEAGNGPDAEALIVTSEMQMAVSRALAELPEKLRTVYTLHHWEDMSYEEIARIERTSISAIKMRIARGRDVLLTKLKAWSERRHE